MSKRILCVGRVVGGAVEIRPTLEERLDAAIARNAEILAMNADLDAMQRQPQRSWIPASDEDEAIGFEFSTQPWRW